MSLLEPPMQITVRCACPSSDDMECWLRRYPPDWCDAMGFPADPPARADVEADGGPCGCACHAFWPPDEPDEELR